MTDTYHDALTMPGACTALWAQVLLQALADATIGIRGSKGSAIQRIREIEAARSYLTAPNRDFDEVCNLAGMDPAAFRERAIRHIASAPSVESLALSPPAARTGRPRKAVQEARV